MSLSSTNSTIPVQSSLPNDAEPQQTNHSHNRPWTTHHQLLVRLPVTSRSAVPGPAPPAAKARTDVKERSVDYPPRAVPPSRSPYRVARLYRPGPETNKIGSLSSLSTERPALRIRETREEKRPAALNGQCRVRTRSPLFYLPFLTLFLPVS